MRRPSHQKTSPRTLALPGFVVSGLSKMRGLMGSAVSFERVQMGPYRRSPLLVLETRAFEVSHSNACSARRGECFSPLKTPEPCCAVARYLNAFKWQLAASMPSLRLSVAQPITGCASTPLDGGRSEFPRDHTLERFARRRGRFARCRGMELVCWRRRWQLTTEWLELQPLQVARIKTTSARELALASGPVLESWNVDLPIALENSSATLRPLSCCCAHSIVTSGSYSSCFALQSAVVETHRLRIPINVGQARSGNALRDGAASSVSATALCTTTALDTASSRIEAPLQFVFRPESIVDRRCAERDHGHRGHDCRAANAVGRTTRAAQATAWPRLSDSSRSSIGDLDVLPQAEALSCDSSERPPGALCARTFSISCVRCQLTLRAWATTPARTPRSHRPHRSSPQRAHTRRPAHPFERVQMRARAHPIYLVGRTPAPAKTYGSVATGGTPMHRLK
jgi:hypothetical protein